LDSKLQARRFRRLPPTALFPSGDPRFRVHRLRLASGLAVRAVECGDPGGVPIVLFPGWSCPAYTFRFLLPLLGNAGYRAIAVEPKGLGLSDKPADPAEYSTDRMVAHVGEILDALGTRRVILGGHSMGAALAARAAAAFAERVTAVLLLSPVGTHGFPGIRVVRLLSPRFLVPLYASLVRRSVVRVVLRWAYGRHGRPTQRDVDEYWAPTQFREYAVAMRELLHHFNWGEKEAFPFARIGVPVLLVSGTIDRLVLRPRVIEHARSVDNVRVVTIEGAGHVIADEVPEIVAREILDFLRLIAPD